MVKLLSEKHNGICCGENYYYNLMESIDVDNQPNLSYINAMTNWQEFISRIPEKYKAFKDSGFFTMVRTENRKIADALEVLEKHFML